MAKGFKSGVLKLEAGQGRDQPIIPNKSLPALAHRSFDLFRLLATGVTESRDRAREGGPKNVAHRTVRLIALVTENI